MYGVCVSVCTGVETKENLLTRHKFTNLPKSVFSLLDRRKMAFLDLKVKLTLYQHQNEINSS